MLQHLPDKWHFYAKNTVKPCIMDSRFIRISHCYGQFALSLGKESLYIFSKIQLNNLLIQTLFMAFSVSILTGFDWKTKEITWKSSNTSIFIQNKKNKTISAHRVELVNYLCLITCSQNIAHSMTSRIVRDNGFDWQGKGILSRFTNWDKGNYNIPDILSFQENSLFWKLSSNGHDARSESAQITNTFTFSANNYFDSRLIGFKFLREVLLNRTSNI